MGALVEMVLVLRNLLNLIPRSFPAPPNFKEKIPGNKVTLSSQERFV